VLQISIAVDPYPVVCLPGGVGDEELAHADTHILTKAIIVTTKVLFMLLFLLMNYLPCITCFRTLLYSFVKKRVLLSSLLSSKLFTDQSV